MNPVGNLLFGTGRPDLALKWNLGQTAIALIILPFAAGAQAIDLALIMLALIAGQILPAWYLLVRRLCDLTFSKYILAIMRPVILASLANLAAYMASNTIENTFVNLASGSVISMAIYVVGSWFLREEWLLIIVSRLGLVGGK
jgi:O-antigen/teichoic acid export membrane protein